MTSFNRDHPRRDLGSHRRRSGRAQARYGSLGLSRPRHALGAPDQSASRPRRPDMSVIAEIKRASPSRGTFPVTVEPATVAADYVAGGAAAISGAHG